jgi:hypothetical protein
MKKDVFPGGGKNTLFWGVGSGNDRIRPFNQFIWPKTITYPCDPQEKRTMSSQQGQHVETTKKNC